MQTHAIDLLSLPLESPDACWKSLKRHEQLLTPLPYIITNPSKTPPLPGNLRFVTISDTHCHHEKLVGCMPAGDVFLFGGDFTEEGTLSEITSFLKFLDSLPYQHKIVIAGNHEFSLDPQCPYFPMKGTPQQKENCAEAYRNLIRKHCTYLQDSSTVIGGITIYGSPYTPFLFDFAFNKERTDMPAHWSTIPSNTDILITHGPVVGRHDRVPKLDRSATQSKGHQGDVALLHAIRSVKPKVHICGHIHEGRGANYDGTTLFINAAFCDAAHKPAHPPYVFDLPMQSSSS